MKGLPKISDAELEVMKVLWKENRPLKIQEVCDRLKNSDWKYNTVGTLLLRMADKGAVVSEKIGRTIYYTPVLNQEEYTQSQTKNLIQRLYNGSVKDLAVSLFKSEGLSKEDVEELRNLFDL